MIRMTLILLACIGVTFAVAGRDLELAEGSDDPGMDAAPMAAAAATEPSNRLALDDEEGAIRRALAPREIAAREPATLEPAAPEPAALRTASLGEIQPAASHYVTGNRVNVRSGPSTANPVVDQVVRDQRVKVLDETPDGWMLIRIVDTGTEAYIFGRFLDPLNG